MQESLMASQRPNGLYSDPCCTEIEWLYLQHCAESYVRRSGFQTLSIELLVQGKKYSINAFQKSTGIYRTWLITQSSNPDLEGMVIKNPLKFPVDNLLRYLHANVVFGQSINNLREVMSQCGLNLPSVAGDFSTSMIYLLEQLGQPVGNNFLPNAQEFSRWTASHFPEISSRPWPTHVGYMGV